MVSRAVCGCLCVCEFCLLGSYLICSAVLELVLFLVTCFYDDGFIHITAGGSLSPDHWGREIETRRTVGDRPAKSCVGSRRGHGSRCLCRADPTQSSPTRWSAVGSDWELEQQQMGGVFGE